MAMSKRKGDGGKMKGRGHAGYLSLVQDGV